MEDFELTLFDRVHVIKDADSKYNLCDNAYLSFSGGKDSTILSELLDLALPGNQIPRVFINTGIEYEAIVGFVKSKEEADSRFLEIRPTEPIIPMLKKFGYPFKSKEHSLKIGEWQKGSKSASIIKYSNGGSFGCPKILKYQLSRAFTLKLSNQCCYRMKKNPIHKWENENKRKIAILGLRADEGGERANHSGCAVFDGGKLIKFKPLNPVSEEWENWFIKKYNIELCELYYPPFNFKRTGCKGCPYALDLQEQLSIMERYMPNERKQCEIIWKPVYDEYRRIGYRLVENEQFKLF